MLLPRQISTLTLKNVLIVFFRHAFSTTGRCFLLPVLFSWFLSYARNLFIPPSHYGIGSPNPVRSLGDAVNAAGGGRDTLAFVDNGFTGGDIEKVIGLVSSPAQADGKTIQILAQEEDLLTTCRNSLRGVSTCIAGVVFWSSPTEGPGGIWNYTLRADGDLGTEIDVTKHSNDQEIYAIPLQHAVDFAIASLNGTIDQAVLPAQILEYPYTSESQQQRNDNIRIHYMGAIIDVLGVAFFIGICGVTYQLVGLMASERELGMSQLIESMMPNARRWEPQVARFISYHLAFDIIYLPGWIAIGVILGFGVFAKTSLATVIIFHLLAGLSLSSFSIFGGAFFQKAQLSGISTTIISLLLAVLAQVIHSTNTGAVAILSLLFPPMNYTFFIILMARWERQNLPTNLVRAAPDNPSTLPGIVFWIFQIIQVIAFPMLGSLVERRLYGTASEGRIVTSQDDDSAAAVKLTGFTKRYDPSWFNRYVASRFGKAEQSVVAVNDLNLSVLKGQILVLLGANGSGKSTTLDTIAGLCTVTSGTVSVDGSHGVGLCPQKNVLWADITVKEHVGIFNRLKETGNPASQLQNRELIRACDLERKIEAQSKTLSGGQKRKLQLAMMFTGGSRVCCVDECSSGVDPLARRKLWDILLAERGKRSIVFTSHFLDEAEILSDHIAILSKGCLKADGSAVALKNRIPGYQIHLYHTPGSPPAPDFEGVSKTITYDQTIYTVSNSAQVATFIEKLEQKGLTEYQVSGSTIEDVFMQVSEEMVASDQSAVVIHEIPKTPNKGLEGQIVESEQKSPDSEKTDQGLQLLTGKHIGPFRQGWVLFRKRWTILRRNYLPYTAALLIPVIAAGLVTLFIKGFALPGCSPTDEVSTSTISSLLSQVEYDLVVGPSSKISLQDLSLFGSTLPGGGSEAGSSFNLSSIHRVDTLDEFNQYINQNFANVTPGGFFLGENGSPPTFAYQGDGDLSLATVTQNALDTLLTNISISCQYQAFDEPWTPNQGKTLNLIVYFGLAMACYPAFFALYPTLERLRQVRALHYSNGVRSLPLWLAYISFDFVTVLAASVISIIIFRAVTNVWYHSEYLFVVLFCYGLSSTLLSYVISLVAKSQLAAFAFAAGYQAVMLLIYFIAYLSVLTYAPANKIDTYVNVVHFTIATITPTGNLARALFVSLNVFSVLCRDRSIATYPGAIDLYGGPIMYLLLQSFFLFGVLLWRDNGFNPLTFFGRKTFKPIDSEEEESYDGEIAGELARVSKSTDDGLRLIHLTKAFGSNVAVQDVSFGVKRGEVFALLGPNGAGKSTIISLIRGDIQPSLNGGEIWIEDVSVNRHRAIARQNLGVCPQFDAMDTMTALEHLRFYARVRGVTDVEHNVKEVLRAVGLQSFQSRMAAKLSGGNKRKLSLGIALMGNPSVLLLDEPSSGMDVCAKRVMWRTLDNVVPGRSIVLSTHSMEEADALATRAGIMAKRMLALGTSDYLRTKHGDRYHVHLVMKTAPHTSEEDMDKVKGWIVEQCPGSTTEQKTYHGQIRFSVPARLAQSNGGEIKRIATDDDGDGNGKADEIERPGHRPTAHGIGALFSKLESSKEVLGFASYSVSQTTLDQVFLSIVGQHSVEEESVGEGARRPLWKKVIGL